MMNLNFVQNRYMDSKDNMNVITTNSTNKINNFLSNLQSNIYQNNPCQKNLNYSERNNFFKNNNCKSIRLFYERKFIQKVNINKNEIYSSINKKFKNILYSLDKVSYRQAGEDEVIERTSPDETLQYLIKRGVIIANPSMIIHQRRTHSIYPYTVYNFDYLEDGEILEVEYGGVTGAGVLNGLEFVDVDDLTKTKKLKFSSKAPNWRKVSIGLNLFGKCLNKKCEAFNAEVIHRVGINKEFDFNSDKRKIKCPICAKNFLPSTMGFWKCEYQIKGEKFKDGEYEEVDLNGKETNGNDFEYYDPYKSGATFWSSLKVFTGHRQKMKFRKFII